MVIDISFKRINQLALPAIISGIAEPVLSSTDAAIVGNMDQEATASLAAVGIVGSLLSMFIWVLGQTRTAISTIIAQNLGADKLAHIHSLPAQAIVFNVVIAFIVLGGTYGFIDYLFAFFNADGRVLSLSLAYYNIRVWGFPLTLFTFAVFGIFRGLQNTFWPMIVAIIGAVVNIVLDIVFVYGVEGYIPAMAVEGAAWASLIAQAVMALLAIVLLYQKTTIRLKLHRTIHPEMSRLVRMSLNLFVRSLSLNIALILAVKEATALGTATIAAHTIAANLWLFSAFFIDGYGAAGNLLSGRLLGAKDFNRLWQVTKKVNTYNLIVAGCIVFLGIAFYKPAGLLFTKETAVLEAFYNVFFIVLLMQPLNAFAFTLDAIFKGLGEMAYLRNTLVIATFLGFVPALYVSRSLDAGFQGIWIAFAVWMLLRASILIYKYRIKYYPLRVSH